MMTRLCSIAVNVKTALDDLISIFNSPEIAQAAKTTPRGFTQTRKITLLDVLSFYTFRSAETTNKDIISYFSKVEKPKVSKQALFKALNKTNPDVFPIIIKRFAEKFYSHGNYNTFDGYLVLACDGTKMDLPPTPEMAEKYGGSMNPFITETEQIKKPQANCSVLIDVLNHMVLDALVMPYNTSEIPMLFKHLENCEELLRGKKVILLCDRYYGTPELFLSCMDHGYHFIGRAKSNMYKVYVSKVEQDDWIHVPFNKAWLRRMKRDDCRNYAKKIASLSLRTVKNRFKYIMSGKKRVQKPIVVDSIYFTNLKEEEFPTTRIVQLYHVQRWDNRTAYFDIKNHLEAERFHSGKYNIVTNELYAKILCFSLSGCFYEAADEKRTQNRQEKESDTQYNYIPNMKYIIDTIRTEHKLLQYLAGSQSSLRKEAWNNYLANILEDISRKVVPVRPGRHYKRWGRWMK